ncbi:glycosyltransferase family 9 protein [Patescibacteria group bacterium]
MPNDCRRNWQETITWLGSLPKMWGWQRFDLTIQGTLLGWLKRRLAFPKHLIIQIDPVGQHMVRQITDERRNQFTNLPELSAFNSPWIRPREVLTKYQLPPRSIVIGLGGTHANKHLPVKLWVPLANLMISQRYQVFLAAHSPDELNLANKIAEKSHAIILDSLNLDELANILSSAQACISHDSGPAHFAAALGTPTLALFHATRSNVFYPLGKFGHSYQSQQSHLCNKFNESSCGMCLDWACQVKKCLPRREELQSAVEQFLTQI